MWQTQEPAVLVSIFTLVFFLNIFLVSTSGKKACNAKEKLFMNNKIAVVK